MAEASIQSARDWVGRPISSLLAWWVPHAAMLAAFLFPVPARAGVWTIALSWMGMACILNAWRCNRTHCRFTGPYLLAFTAPVLAFGFGIVSAGIYAWVLLAVLIVAGSGLIWWATERAWGRFS